MKAVVGLLLFCCTTHMTFSARAVTITTNMPRSFALGGVITRCAIAIQLKSDGFSRYTMTGYNRRYMRLTGYGICQLTLLIKQRYHNSLDSWFYSLELFRNTCVSGCWEKVRVVLLEKKLSGEVTMIHVYIPVFIPALGSIARYIVPKDINKASIYRVSIGKSTIRIWHAMGILLLNGQIAPSWHKIFVKQVKHVASKHVSFH